MKPDGIGVIALAGRWDGPGDDQAGSLASRAADWDMCLLQTQVSRDLGQQGWKLSIDGQQQRQQSFCITFFHFLPPREK